MKYFVCYNEIFLNDDLNKREVIRTEAYNLTIKFLTRKQIPNNFICDEFNQLKAFFESKEFTDVYFLSPFIINQSKLSKDMMNIVVSSGESNLFNQLFQEIKNEVNQIKAGSIIISNKYIKVSSADEYLEKYLQDPSSRLVIDLQDKEEWKILNENINNGVKSKDINLTILYTKLKEKEVKNINDLLELIDMLEKIESNCKQALIYNQLSKLYQNKYYTKEDKLSKIIENYTKADELDDGHAAYMLGLMYFTGTGFKKDEQKALSYFEKASKKDDPDAISGLGIYYLTHNDKQKAKEYLSKSANMLDYKALLLLDTDFYRK